MRGLVGLLVLLLSGPAAPAETWPVRPVTLIVPFQAGSSVDILARILADGLNAALKQPFIVENRAGASGNIGTNAVAKAPPDGYTIGLSIGGPLALNAFIFPSMPYVTSRDLALVSVVAEQPNVLTVSDAFGTADMAAFKGRLAATPTGLNYGSIGNGSLSHLAMATIARDLAARPAHIPFGGAPGVVTALLRDDVQMAIIPAPAVVPQARDGKLRMLAVTNGSRSPILPDLPTLAESGFPTIRSAAWIGLIAPAGTPDAVLDRLRAETVRVLSDPATREKLSGQFMQPVGSTGAEFKALVDDEVARWGDFIRLNGIRPGG